MTHPNLLHLARSCAKWRCGVLLVAALACTPAGAAPIRVDGPMGTLDAAAPGDTLRYTVTGPTVGGATSYIWNVTATPGIWTGLPVGQSTTSPSVAFAAAAPASWDSVTFVVTFQGKSANRSSNTLSATWKVKKSLVAVGPLVVDSSGVGPISLLLKPDSTRLAVGASRILCAFNQYASGAVVQYTATKASCDSIYVKYIPLAARTVTSAQQAQTDSLQRNCITYETPSALALGLQPLVPCAGAVQVTGLGLSFRAPPAGEGTINRHGRFRCVKPGYVTVTARIQRLARPDSLVRWVVLCRGTPTVLAGR